LPISLDALWKASESADPNQMSFSFVPARKPMGREDAVSEERAERFGRA